MFVPDIPSFLLLVTFSGPGVRDSVTLNYLFEKETGFLLLQGIISYFPVFLRKLLFENGIDQLEVRFLLIIIV